MLLCGDETFKRQRSSGVEAGGPYSSQQANRLGPRSMPLEGLLPVYVLLRCQEVSVCPCHMPLCGSDHHFLSHSMLKKQRLDDHERRPPNPFLFFKLIISNILLAELKGWLTSFRYTIHKTSPGQVTYLCTQDSVLFPSTGGSGTWQAVPGSLSREVAQLKCFTSLGCLTLWAIPHWSATALSPPNLQQGELSSIFLWEKIILLKICIPASGKDCCYTDEKFNQR